MCDVKTFYRYMYFNVIDTVVKAVSCTSGISSLVKHCTITLNVVSQLNYESQLSDVVGIYSDQANHYGWST